MHFSDISLKAGDPRTTAVEAHVQDLEISMSLMALAHRELLIYALNLRNPFIELMDGEQHSPPSHSPAIVEFPFLFEIQNTTLSGGVFRYVSRNSKLGTSRLEFSQIDGHSDRFSNRPQLMRSLTHSTLTGINSPVLRDETGSTKPRPDQDQRKHQTLTLDLKVNYLVQPTRAEVELTANNQSLKPMGEFLSRNDGIRLSGKIDSGNAKVKVQGRSIWAELSSRYSDLKVAIEPTAERSPLSASLMNLGAKLAIREKSKGVQPVRVADSAQSDRSVTPRSTTSSATLATPSLAPAMPGSETSAKAELETKRIFYRARRV